ncbi:hypothetical protein ACHAXA_005338 [Cyclostephanos tholiformis]|uniref:GP-PDE domain-containing protein n=1 Tax=Cyclostephanos tholiformis TaxID=382380 RepID=A0ABD3R6T0_9STRA
MVKFGRHLQFYLEGDVQSSPDGGGSEPFIVPYTDIRECIGMSQTQFVRAWQTSLRAASDDYAHRVRKLWEMIFDDLFRSSDAAERQCRGLTFDRAVSLYASTLDEGRSRDLFATIKRIHSAASMNVEAFRKLVKKFDKCAIARGDDMLTSTLIPQLYSAPLMAYPTLEGHIETLRDSMAVEDDEEEIDGVDDDSIMHSIRRKTAFVTKDSADVRRRADELSWLHDMLAGVPSGEIPRLVAHRGFHCPRDNSGKRPLENSLSAYESAWSAGIHLCECDVALTKDEKLVLAHDEDFSRLALDPSTASSRKKVGDLTMKEIISLTFKSGSRPPLLLDVLRSAQAIGGFARLVIEIKPGNQVACAALINLFRQHPDLIERCAVIMSFDAYTMHKLKCGLNELDAWLDTHYGSRSDSPDSVLSFEDEHGRFVSFGPKLPNILLLTVLRESTRKQHHQLPVSVSDLSPVHSWLRPEDKPSLDGVYLQYQPEMLQREGIAAMQALSKEYLVGVWARHGDPDDIVTASRLMKECGVSFVNTDLPRTFAGKQLA